LVIKIVSRNICHIPWDPLLCVCGIITRHGGQQQNTVRSFNPRPEHRCYHRLSQRM